MTVNLYRKGVPLIITLTIILLSTGCVNADYHVIIHQDGSGTYRVKVMTPSVIADQLDPFQEKMKNSGYRVREIRKNNHAGWLAEKDVKSVVEDPPGEELKEILGPSGKTAGLIPFPREGSKGPVRIEKSWFQYRIFLQTEADLTHLRADNPMKRFLWKETNLHFRLTLPLKPEEHNADQVSEDGKTLTWKLDPGEKNPVRVLVKFPNPVGWVLSLAIVFILLFLFLYLFRSRLLRRR